VTVAGVSDRIVLVDEEGQEIAFELLRVIAVGSKRYALVRPEDSVDIVTVLRLESRDNEDVLVSLNDDREFEKVVAELEHDGVLDGIVLSTADPEGAIPQRHHGS